MVRKVLDSARAKGRAVEPGDLAKYLLDFDRQKRSTTFNYSAYIRDGKKLCLHTDDGPTLRIDLETNELRRIFGHAFNRGLRLVKDEARRTPSTTQGLVAIFTGGR